MEGNDLLHPAIETLSDADLRRHQDQVWPRQWEYVRARSKFYRRKLGQVAADLVLDRLQDLPFTCLLYTSPSPRDS